METLRNWLVQPEVNKQVVSKASQNVSSRISELMINDTDLEFHDLRNAVLDEVNAANPELAWYVIRKIDIGFWKMYFAEVIEPLSLLPETHQLYQIRRRFLRDLKNGEISFSYLQEIFYGQNGANRGVYFHDNSEISLRILPPDQMLTPLIHELGHRYDEDLRFYNSENELTLLKNEVYQFYPTDENDARRKPRNLLLRMGMYWFYSELFYDYYREAWPKFLACQAFLKVRKLGGLENAAPEEISKYEGSISGGESIDDFCTSLVSNELREIHGSPPRVWNENQWQHRWLQKYLEIWRKQKGFTQKIYER